jgi:hydrogenase maturation protein HypF
VVSGVVQGVGFRPFAYRLASELGLGGFVGNDSASVFIEVEGPPGALDRFAERLVGDAPPLARIHAVSVSAVLPNGEGEFRIVASVAGLGGRTPVPPEIGVCDECMAEVADPHNRRFRYSFTNCTNCGPRFTIIRDLPYDRPSTTMAAFKMCAACRAEYESPGDRRYHAQPVACPACGPHLSYQASSPVVGAPVARSPVARSPVVTGDDDALTAAQACLAAGGTVAIKGVGGYHLCCDASSEGAVRQLRTRKARAGKPFAVMVPDLAAAQELAFIDDAEAEALLSPARPIVLVRRRPGAGITELVAPGNPRTGLMLPYTPLHHLLFQRVPGADIAPPTAVVLTSGNLADEPICTEDADAQLRLAPLADAFLAHDRPISTPCDDSVVRLISQSEQPVRRSRGYAPVPVNLPVEVVPTLAVGGELKNTFCLAAGSYAWVSQHIGDMGSLETLAAFERGVQSFEQMYAVTPQRWATDRHPGYATRRWARAHASGPVVEVQHHHAHVASAMVEHGLDGSAPVVGFAFDGTGYGTGDDGRPEIWGGEVLVADYRGFERAGHLRPLPLPGGDAAVHNPCRTAVAYLAALGIEVSGDVPSVAACSDIELRVVLQQVEGNVGCVPTTSMGRLFDAVASLLGLRHRITYEAQAAMELEGAAEAGRLPRLPAPLAFALGDDGTIDMAPLVRGLLAGLAAGAPVPDLALGFHAAVADMVRHVAARLRSRQGPMPVVLTGGVFQNGTLAELARSALEQDGHQVLTHRTVPPNDGGLSLGQAVVAGYGRS